MPHGFPFTLLANPPRSFHCSFFGSFPADAVCLWCPAFPSRMSQSDHKLRLPFSHAGTGTEWFFGVEISRSAAKVFEALSACLSDAIASSRIWLPNLRSHAAGKRAKHLAPLTSARGWFAARRARRLLSSSPSVEQIAPGRTESLSRSAVLRAKLLIALCAVARFFGSHVNIIAQIEEKYCEIAVKRLAQEVLAL